MKAVAKFGQRVDLVEVPQEIISCFEELAHEYLAWLYDEGIEHPFWRYENGQKVGAQRDGESFVLWLNRVVLTGTGMEAQLLEQDAKTWDSALPVLDF